MRKKVVFFVSRLPIPVNDGRSYTLNQYIDVLVKRHDVYLVSLKGNKLKENQVNGIKEIYELKPPSTFEKIKNVFSLTLLHNLPFQISAVYSKSAQREFNKIIEEIKPDYIIIDMIRFSYYMEKLRYDGIRILDMDDRLSRRYSEDFSGKNAFGQLSQSLPNSIVKLTHLLNLDKLILKKEKKKMNKMEIDIVNKFNNIILVSKKEVEMLIKDSKSNNIVSWPVCVNNFYDYNEKYDQNQLCFFGNMNVPQNQETLDFICEKVMPKLSDNFKLIVLGNCSKEIMVKYKKYKNIKFTGYVDSIKDILQSSLCLLAPIQFGSGIKIKIIEGLSYAIPIITTNVGVEGIDVANNENIVICSDEYEIVEKINELFSSPNLRKKIGEKGLEFVKANHNYEKLEKSIYDIIS